ncbi:tRNA lysidine(34) synthetase TilS [Roseibium sp.]|uniref:tRNA lysidine(34) synthetase TilS n=1 Tax=Roseibium sp. TaxID=1936156 RepID=UPI003A980F59
MADAPDQAVPAEGLSEDQADSLFAVLFPFKSLAIGVSGGSDSVALLRLLHDWQLRSRWSGEFQVLTVDHGLRPESAVEARFVADLSERFGMSHQTLVWNGPKPLSNIQAAARVARYSLMREAMVSIGAQALVLAHHQDDQVETFLDRLTRGSGAYGLGAMRADQPDGPAGIRILRPLLAIPKSDLVATLERRGQRWCEDPSNHKTSYKRARLRHLAGALAKEGFEASRLLETARRMQRTADAIDHWVNGVFEREVEVHPAGPLRMTVNAFEALPEEVRLRLLARMIAEVSPRPYSPRMSALENADALLASRSEAKLTVGGAVLCRKGSGIVMWAEVGREPSEVRLLVAGEAIVLSQRYRVGLRKNGAPFAEIFVGPLAKAPSAIRTTLAFGDWPKAAFAASPAVWNDGEIHVPGLEGCGGELERSCCVEKI